MKVHGRQTAFIPKRAGVVSLAVSFGMLASILIPAQGIGAAMLSFGADADAHVSATKPMRNFGSTKDLLVDDSPTEVTYIRFRVGNLSGTVNEAAVRIYANRSRPSGYEIWTVPDTGWGERSITFNNAPSLGVRLGTSGSSSLNTWISFDVTPAVLAGQVVSFAFVAVAPASGGDLASASFSSRESSRKPSLVLGNLAGPEPSPSPSPSPSPGSDVQPSFPIRAAFYYPWFPQAWKQRDIYPYTRFTPSLGLYHSDDPALIASHIRSMRHARIQAGIASWWGIGHQTDGKIPLLLDGALGSDFRWTLYYEKEGNWDPPVEELRADFTHILDRYATHPAYLRIGGKPVLFVYGQQETCQTADRWAEANQGRFHVVLKVWSQYRYCDRMPDIDGWHQYSPGHRRQHIPAWSYSASAGFWKMTEDEPRLSRDPAEFRAAVADMVASGEPWQLVFFNEWGENSAIESAAEWATASDQGAYLDALRGSG